MTHYEIDLKIWYNILYLFSKIKNLSEFLKKMLEFQKENWSEPLFSISFISFFYAYFWENDIIRRYSITQLSLLKEYYINCVIYIVAINTPSVSSSKVISGFQTVIKEYIMLPKKEKGATINNF